MARPFVITGVEDTEEIESDWTGGRRERIGMPLRAKVTEPRHPSRPGLEPALSQVEDWGSLKTVGRVTRP